MKMPVQLVAVAAGAAIGFWSGCSSPPYRPHVSGISPLAVPPDVECRNGTFVGVREAKLFEQSWRPTGASRATVVLVHGLKDHSTRYHALATMLASRSITVHAFDLRGLGYSEGVREHVDSFDDHVADLDRFIGRVRDRETGAPLFLLGHSMGGAIVALYAARKQPDGAPDLAGVILSAAALTTDASGTLRFGAKLKSKLAPKSQTLELDLAKFSRSKAAVESLRSDPLVHQGDATARTARELLRAIDELHVKMGLISVPLLIMHGTGDTITDPEGSRELYSRARTKDKKLTLYPGLYHDLLHEPEHDQVAEDIYVWVRKHAEQARRPPAPLVAPGLPPAAGTQQKKPAADAKRKIQL